MKGQAAVFALVVLGGACSHSQIPAAGPPVSGTFATVNGRTFSPLHIGEVLGHFRKVGGGCQGSQSVGSDRSGVGIETGFTSDCTLYVRSITPNESESPPPTGGTFVTPSAAPS